MGTRAVEQSPAASFWEEFQDFEILSALGKERKQKMLLMFPKSQS